MEPDTLAEFEMRACDYAKPIFDVEYPTGSCMFFRTSVLQHINGFDPDYFLHYEDADIGRRILQVAQIRYVPEHCLLKASYEPVLHAKMGPRPGVAHFSCSLSMLPQLHVEI